ncbi:Serum amyloid A-like 1 [Nesidiocoris tenuis]|uniref:Serum amyloid A-like 1 n=1 Tax=Nesidiocoris tenuis TaxID=355587 RepID=A0ABN7B991_9HEMI|nr:Serum amyloid A-like 1 [Nesidiocoris tenuis]
MNSDQSPEEPLNVNPSVDDVGAEYLEKMKGDAIGDTMYSERWVLQTLIKFTMLFDTDWDEDLESEFCSLWDTTVEKDIVDFLLKHNFLSIAGCALRPTSRKNNSRLTEILVGIVSNLCCHESVRSELPKNPELIYQLISLLDDPDPHVLIQLTRLFHSCAWDLISESSPGQQQHWLEGPINSGQLNNIFSFILKSSTNEELICVVLEFLNTMCSLEVNDKDFSQYFCTPEMISAMTDAWHQLFSNWNPEDEFPSKLLTKAAAHWTTVLVAFVGHEHGRDLVCENGIDLGHILMRIALRPVECFDAILIATVNLLEVLIKIYFNGTVLKRLLEVLNVLYQNPNNGPDASVEDDNSKVVLQDSIESYCSNVFLIVSRPTLNYILAECSENHVLLFWKVINERQSDEGEAGERAI